MTSQNELSLDVRALHEVIHDEDDRNDRRDDALSPQIAAASLSKHVISHSPGSMATGLTRWSTLKPERLLAPSSRISGVN